MPRKGKEPAGLRRWRLAHRRKHRVRRAKVVHHMARRRYGHKRHGRRGSRAVPILQTVTVGAPLVLPFVEGGLNVGSANLAVWNVSGYDFLQKKFTSPKNGIILGLGLLAESTIGAKIANKTGINRIIKRMTGGMLKLA